MIAQASDDSRRHERVAVIGAGVVGLACAYELRREGAEVVVLERGRVGGGASQGNAGWVVPSLTAPLAAPGVVREGLRQLVTRGEAFVLRPSLDPSFVHWLWSFWRHSSAARFDAGVRALLALNRRTFELFDAYRDAGIEFEMQATGLVFAARSREPIERTSRLFARLRELGYEGGQVEELDGHALAELEPALDATRVVAGLHARLDRFVRPEELTAGLARRLRADGAELRENCELQVLAFRNRTWELQTTDGAVSADAVVVAAGVPTAPLLRRLGVRVPLAPARGYSVTLAGRGAPPRHALYLSEARLGVTPFVGGVRIAGVFELGAREQQVPPGTAERLLAAARPFLAGWLPEPDGPLEAWAGLRPVTPDGLPLVGRVPGHSGLYLATGHAMLGVTLAPATAALLAPLVLHGSAAPELAPFDPARRL